MANATKLSPEVLWAQREDIVYLTINLPDCKVETLDLQPTTIKFQGTSGDKSYAFELEFYKEINPEESKKAATDRNILMILNKADHDNDYWPRLQKPKQKPNYLKTDFDKWKDEDDEEEAGGNGMPDMSSLDFSSMAQSMGGGMGDMMSGMGGGMPPMDFGAEPEDSGDEDEDVEMPTAS
ncbi:p23 chaperone protein wos2 [Dimargaris xerosporica]|nr:p23 chaperone protein wos2 [Dimargaris xerosporica]